MAEIKKYRGKSKQTGKWVYGWPVIDDEGKYYIISKFHNKKSFSITYQEVVPETVGQYTGFKDKGGREIYHKDLFKTPQGIMIIEWDKDGMWHLVNSETELRFDLLWRWAKIGEVIGYRFKNPKLMEVSDNG